VYIPSHFQEERLDVLHEFIRAHPFAMLVTQGPEGMIASHIPLLLDAATSPMGTLRGHLARANSQWKEFEQSVDALAIFNGPQHYISPTWYPSKADHGKVVPTWNYVAVHAYGRIRIVEDRDRLLDHLRKLTDSQEAGRPNRWRVDDAPADYIDGLTRAIVGVEIRIGRLEGKWKVSQNRPAGDREAVAARLREFGDEGALAMAELIEQNNTLVEQEPEI
jgi:transcriptional regulator